MDHRYLRAPQYRSLNPGAGSSRAAPDPAPTPNRALCSPNHATPRSSSCPAGPVQFPAGPCGGTHQRRTAPAHMSQSAQRHFSRADTVAQQRRIAPLSGSGTPRRARFPAHPPALLPAGVSSLFCRQRLQHSPGCIPYLPCQRQIQRRPVYQRSAEFLPLRQTAPGMLHRFGMPPNLLSQTQRLVQLPSFHIRFSATSAVSAAADTYAADLGDLLSLGSNS